MRAHKCVITSLTSLKLTKLLITHKDAIFPNQHCHWTLALMTKRFDKLLSCCGDTSCYKALQLHWQIFGMQVPVAGRRSRPLEASVAEEADISGGIGVTEDEEDGRRHLQVSPARSERLIYHISAVWRDTQQCN